VQDAQHRLRRPEQLPDGTVVVVGGGNTGYQIAEELVPFREVHLAVGARQTPLPQRILGRDVFDYLKRLGLMTKTVDSRLAQRLKDRETLIGSSPRRARKQGHPAAQAGHRRARHQPELRRRQPAAGQRGDLGDGLRLDHSLVQLPVFAPTGASSTAAA
jgi:putative flavoprotein involved in K+ transport